MKQNLILTLPNVRACLFLMSYSLLCSFIVMLFVLKSAKIKYVSSWTVGYTNHE